MRPDLIYCRNCGKQIFKTSARTWYHVITGSVSCVLGRRDGTKAEPGTTDVTA